MPIANTAQKTDNTDNTPPIKIQKILTAVFSFIPPNMLKAEPTSIKATLIITIKTNNFSLSIIPLKKSPATIGNRITFQPLSVHHKNETFQLICQLSFYRLPLMFPQKKPIAHYLQIFYIPSQNH